MTVGLSHEEMATVIGRCYNGFAQHRAKSVADSFRVAEVIGG